MKEKWIGLVRLAPIARSELLTSGEGAFVNVLALAEALIEYSKSVATASRELGCRVVKIEDAEPLGKRLQHYTVDTNLQSISY
jgi:hypothetical protein